MAVPVIGVVSKTKTTGLSFVSDHLGTQVNLGSSYPSGSHTENTALRLSSVPDGYRLHFFTNTHGGQGHSGLIRAVGVTSNTTIWSEQGNQSAWGNNFHQRNIVKNTGVTEDVKIEIDGNGSSAFHCNTMIHGTSAGDLSWIPVVDGGKTVIHKTMQIDDIDVVSILCYPASQTINCPEIGHNTIANDNDVYNYTSINMINRLTVNCTGSTDGTTSSDNNRNGNNGILYTYTGKELSMS